MMDSIDIELQRNLNQLKEKFNRINKQIRLLNEEKCSLQKQIDETQCRIDAARVKSLSHSNDVVCSQYDDLMRFPWGVEVNRVASEVFKISKLRPLQIKAINGILDGLDTILVMPTGAGKSLVYQLPALIDWSNVNDKIQSIGSITLVISPLVSLMTDQAMNLARYHNISPDSIAVMDSSTPLTEQRKILSQLGDKKTKSIIRLLYVTPEKLAKSKLLLNRLESAYECQRLARIAIDEIHCISQWGHDFRPDYKFLHVLKRQFPQTPIIGLTATASVELIVDIQNMLSINPEKCLVLKTSYNRNNLNYEVRMCNNSVKNSIDYLYSIIDENYKGKSGIVYCFSQKDTEEVATGLQKYHINAAPYHAYLDANYKSKIHSSWMEGKTQVIVATVAFGMGINKADVRFVIHYSISKSVENYYQESGRAGRDSQPADCLVIWRFSDIFRLASMVSNERKGLSKLYEMTAYCIESTNCRRQLIANCFDDATWSESDCNQMCDNCRSKDKKTNSFVLLQIGELLHETELLLQHKERVTGPKLIDILGTTKQIQTVAQKLFKHNNNNSSGKIERKFYEYFLSWCLIKQYLKIEFHYTPYSTVCYVNTTNSNSDLIRNDLCMPYLITDENQAKTAPKRSKLPLQSSQDKKVCIEHIDLSTDSEDD